MTHPGDNRIAAFPQNPGPSGVSPTALSKHVLSSTQVDAEGLKPVLSSAPAGVEGLKPVLSSAPTEAEGRSLASTAA
jgi:hypothetical protein